MRTMTSKLQFPTLFAVRTAGAVLAFGMLAVPGAVAQDNTLGAAPAPVQVSAATDTNVKLESRALSVPAVLGDLKTKAAAAVAVRLTLLGSFGPRLTAAKGDCGTNATLSGLIAQTTAGETSLGSAITTETDLVKARAEYKQIFENYRVYALVGPKTGLTLSCDALSAYAIKLTAEAARLQGKIDAAKAKGTDVAASQSAHDTAVTETAAITGAATTVLNSVIGLNPDKGDRTIIASNRASVLGAVTAMKTEHQAARTAADTLRNGFLSLPHNTSKNPKQTSATTPTLTSTVKP